MRRDNSTVIQYSDLKDVDIINKLQQSMSITCKVSAKQAKRIKHDWGKYDNYKLAYAVGDAKRGLKLSFIWMISNIYTSFFYGHLEKITYLYYDSNLKLMPVEFLDTAEDDVSVIFRKK